MSWSNLIWTRISIPRHAFIAWILIQHRLPTEARLSKFRPQTDTNCPFCQGAEEDDRHLFFTCPYAMQIWTAVCQWWPMQLPVAITDSERLLTGIPTPRAPKTQRRITYAVFLAVIYSIWKVRNHMISKNKLLPPSTTISSIKEQLRFRILFLSKYAQKYQAYIDILIQ